MKRVLFVLLMSLFLLVGCSNNTNAKVDEFIMPLEFTYNNEVFSFHQGVKIDDFKAYTVLEVAPPMVAKKDAETITFVYVFDVHGESLKTGIETKYLGGRDISTESENVEKDGILQYYSFEIEDLNPGMLMYNGVDMLEVNAEVLTEWSGKETVLNPKEAWYTFEFKGGSIRFMLEENTDQIKGFSFRPSKAS